MPKIINLKQYCENHKDEDHCRYYLRAPIHKTIQQRGYDDLLKTVNYKGYALQDLILEGNKLGLSKPLSEIAYFN